jgi:hypothetical protein
MKHQGIQKLFHDRQPWTLTLSPDPPRFGVCVSGGEAAATGEGAGGDAVEGEKEEKGVVSDLTVVDGGAVVGVGKLDVFTMAGGATGGAGVGLEGGADGGDGVAAKMAPFSRLTRLGVADLPEKYSPAEREGSAAGAGGKMSDWKLSAWVLSVNVRLVMNVRESR